jgi:hypothetical protein
MPWLVEGCDTVLTCQTASHHQHLLGPFQAFGITLAEPDNAALAADISS